METILSIIVPVYKVESYLPKCLESILTQTFRDFELILVDDGSPDCCPAICDEYAVRDKRVVVIHQANAGVSAARNTGLARARGKYIGFVDPDDWIAPEMYEEMIACIEKSNADLAVCGCTIVDKYRTEQNRTEQNRTEQRTCRSRFFTATF